MTFRKLKLVWRLRKLLIEVLKHLIENHPKDLEAFLLSFTVGDVAMREKDLRKLGEDLLQSFAEMTRLRYMKDGETT